MPRTLPVLRPITPTALARFDLVESTPIALAVLRAHLGVRDTARVLVHIARRAVVADPLRALGPVRDRDDALSRQQLRSVLLLDDALREDLALDEGRAFAIVRAVMLASGARFLARFQPSISREDWASVGDEARARFARALVARLFNARVAHVEATHDALAFDVGACRFVELLRALDRAHLAPLFCEVDSAFVARDGSQLRLDRAGTIARGAARCDFRFSLRIE